METLESLYLKKENIKNLKEEYEKYKNIGYLKYFISVFSFLIIVLATFGYLFYYSYNTLSMFKEELSSSYFFGMSFFIELLMYFSGIITAIFTFCLVTILFSLGNIFNNIKDEINKKEEFYKLKYTSKDDIEKNIKLSEKEYFNLLNSVNLNLEMLKLINTIEKYNLIKKDIHDKHKKSIEKIKNENIYKEENLFKICSS